MISESKESSMRNIAGQRRIKSEVRLHKEMNVAECGVAQTSHELVGSSTKMTQGSWQTQEEDGT